VVEKVEHVEQPTWIPANVHTFLLYLLYRYSTRTRWYVSENRRRSIYSIDSWVRQAPTDPLAYEKRMEVITRLTTDMRQGFRVQKGLYGLQVRLKSG